ncbi:MAG: SURF1 family protein [Pseudomonadota bacterium]
MRPLWLDTAILISAGVIFTVMMGLGIWQVQRLGWKLDLIEAVETRAFAEPVKAPAVPVNAADHAYMRVTLTGSFDHSASRKVKAVTELGPGHWLMTPFVNEGRVVWINRGFVHTGVLDTALTEPKGEVQITGLLRMAEVGGTLLERNRPDIDRWVSRDVVALSKAAGFSAPKPYFIDAEHMGAETAWPRGGLTKLQFRNSHLSYAITWFAMAALFLGAMIYVIWDRRRQGTPKT